MDEGSDFFFSEDRWERLLEERASAAQRMRAARDSLAASLAASYNPVHAEWHEDPRSSRAST